MWNPQQAQMMAYMQQQQQWASNGHSAAAPGMRPVMPTAAAGSVTAHTTPQVVQQQSSAPTPTTSTTTALPEGWTSHFDPASNYTYYFHAETQTRQWLHPVTNIATPGPLPQQPAAQPAQVAQTQPTQQTQYQPLQAQPTQYQAQQPQQYQKQQQQYQPAPSTQSQAALGGAPGMNPYQMAGMPGSQNGASQYLMPQMGANSSINGFGGRPPLGAGRGGGGGGGEKRGRVPKRAKDDTPFDDIGSREFDQIEKLDAEVNAYRDEHQIKTSGGCLPPWMSYAQAPLPPQIRADFQKAGYVQPSVIQAVAWPNALGGRDVVGVAKTGSGKTLGFLIPSFLRILKKPRADLRQGPVTLVLAPTRELALQIREEVVKFGTSSQISSTCVFGGSPKGPQLSALRTGVHILIATPGRLNDFLEMNAVNLRQINYLVFDEADRMLDMGFEPQIRKILGFCPRDRQTLFFTATWPREVRRLASEFLHDPVLIYIGDTENLQANKDVQQVVHVVQDQRQKDQLMETLLKQLGRDALTLIFCGTKRMCDQLERNLGRHVQCAAIHGDKDQNQRNNVLQQFKSGRTPVMIATDVAARGLDVKGVACVINYDFPQNVEDYVHRIGRTGRAGAKGLAHTYMTSKDARKASDVIKLMEGAGQEVPPALRQLAASGGGRYDGGSTMRFSNGGGRGGGSSGGPPRPRSRSRSRPRRDSRGRRHSRSRSKSGRRKDRSRSRSHDRRRRSRSDSRERSYSRERSDSRSRTPPRKRFRERSASPRASPQDGPVNDRWRAPDEPKV